MNIAVVMPYKEYYNDKLFDPSSCSIGQNLLLPDIMLKERLEEKGYNYHTVDMYNVEDVDIYIFRDINKSASILTIKGIREFLSYFLKKKWKRDYLYIACKKLKKKSILVIQEPPIIFSQSYNIKIHKYFDIVLTWSDMFHSEKYKHFFYPQIMPKEKKNISFSEKKFTTMICGNKKSSDNNELYSERYNVIKWFENKKEKFDLYGVGWEKEGLKNYKGPIKDKLDVLSKYKFSFCYENMCNINGYITEKIFDCFFANVVPIYWGAKDIIKFIPENCFIDRRKFDTLDELVMYLEKIDEVQYTKYIKNINDFLKSDIYKMYFSVDSYLERMEQCIENLVAE